MYLTSNLVYLPCMCKRSENIIKNCIYELITSSSYVYFHQRDGQEFMTYSYKTQIQLCLNTGDRAGHMYDKAHAQQQQQRRVTQILHLTTIPPPPKKLENYIQKNVSHNINHTLIQYQSNPSTMYFLSFFFFFFSSLAIYKPTIKSKNRSS